MFTKIKRIGILTSGGLAPCLSATIASLIETYKKQGFEGEFLFYLHGWRGVLQGKTLVAGPAIQDKISLLYTFGGTPIGSSRVKLSNQKDCIKKGLIRENEVAMKIAAEQIKKDAIEILHPIGGDDTSLMAAELFKFLKEANYELVMIGLPKTIDNDIAPIAQSLGAYTAAEEGAHFFANIVHEHNSSPRTLIIHEVMGRHCGWLTVHTAINYREKLKEKVFFPEIGFSKRHFDLHGVYIPEIHFDPLQDADRLTKVMDKLGCVNLFLSESTGAYSLEKELLLQGEAIAKDAYGHVHLDKLNVGQWIGDQLGKAIRAEKVLIQKSGYFARSAPPNFKDIQLIQGYADCAVKSAELKESGIVGANENKGNLIETIPFQEIQGSKSYDIQKSEWKALLKEIGQVS